MPQMLGLSRLHRESAPAPSPLEDLRAEIDRLDDALLDLIERRLAASLSIAARKESDSNRTLKFRPRRETEIIGRLIGRAERASPQLVTHVWRELMAHCLQAQVRTELVLCATGRPHGLKERVRERFGRAANAQWVATPAEALAIAREREAVAAIEYSPLNPWWTALRRSDLTAFDLLREESGRLLAILVGRVGREDTTERARLHVLTEGELDIRCARGDMLESISASGGLRLCLTSHEEAIR